MTTPPRFARPILTTVLALTTLALTLLL